MEESDLDLVIAGTRTPSPMIEGFAREMSEENMPRPSSSGTSRSEIVDLIEHFRNKAELGPRKSRRSDQASSQTFQGICSIPRFSPIEADLRKHARAEKIRELAKRLRRVPSRRRQRKYPPEQVRVGFPSPGRTRGPRPHFSKASASTPGTKDLRQITCEVACWPRTHGDGDLQRGETRPWLPPLSAPPATNNAVRPDPTNTRRSSCWITFPAFQRGGMRPIRVPGRREIGHGALSRTQP